MLQAFLGLAWGVHGGGLGLKGLVRDLGLRGVVAQGSSVVDIQFRHAAASILDSSLRQVFPQHPPLDVDMHAR